MKNYLTKLSKLNVILLAIIGLLSATILLFTNFRNIFYDKNSDIKTQIEIDQKKVELKKELPSFEVTYYIFHRRFLLEYISRKFPKGSDFPEDFLLNKTLLENEVYNEYITKFDNSNTHTDIDATSLYTLDIKQIGNSIAKDVSIKIKKIFLFKPILNFNSKTLNGLHNNISGNPNISVSTDEIIDLGDINFGKSILLPTLVGYNKYNNKIDSLIENAKSGLTILLPEKLYFKNFLTNKTDSVNIRPLLNYDINIGLYISGKG